ncbi:MAG TPA: hypothetical protein VGO06_01720 [Bosea sp. (in: a-proteobacteria)]|jgi:hypothetical protein|uniref:hypothetical protein n=1 Tax=Bosea sp. (in: a-proteobacteria) TaxID=1871050 RepID=UPI002E133A66|nr:hypothetical protein [Bosea sp. (in: a-proteobacteria)]
MRALLILAALGWAISPPWMAVFGYIVLIVSPIAVLWLISVSIERRAVSNSSAGNTIDADYVTLLENMVVEAEAEVEKLRGEIERLRLGAASEPDPKAALFRRVGLNENAPKWLISAARRAYRVALHPDKHPVHRKQEAERRLKMAEGLFDQIAARS